MRIKPIILDVVEDDGMWLDKSTMTYYSKDQLEPVIEEETHIVCEGRVSSQQGKRGIVTTEVINDIGELMVSDKVTVLIKKKEK